MTITSNRQQQRRRLASLLFVSLGLLTVLPVQADLPPIRESRPMGEAPVPPTTVNDKPTLSLEDRVSRLERLLQGQALVDMMIKIEGLQTEVQELRGQNEVYAHEIEGMKKRQRDLYMDIDRRLRQATDSAAANGSAAAGGQMGMPSASMSAAPSPQMPGGQKQAGQPRPGVAPAAGAMTTATAAAQEQGVVDPQAEQAAYRTAFDVLKDGRYEDSIAEFNRFLQAYPNGQYADNANYWIGEANYVLRRFQAAIESFKRVTEKYPNSPKLADAKLKIGYSLYELKEWDKARQVLEEVMQDAPSTTASQLAANRLRQMKVEGH
jgi:tol-pal system protein YbgF